MLDPRVRQRQRLRNAIQGFLLLGALVAVAAGLAWLLLGLAGLLWVVLLGAVVALLRPRIPARTMLSLYGARPPPEAAAPRLHQILRVLAERAGLPTAPALYYVPSPLTNAFAVGSGADAGLAVTDGLLRRLTLREVAAVLAHEVSHVRAGDTVVMNLSDGIARLVHGLSYFGMLSVLVTLPLMFAGDVRPLVLSAVLVVLPTVVTLLQLALSRSREYDADLEGAALTGDPEGLAAALETLERSDGRIWERTMVPRGRVPDPLLRARSRWSSTASGTSARTPSSIPGWTTEADAKDERSRKRMAAVDALHGPVREQWLPEVGNPRHPKLASRNRGRRRPCEAVWSAGASRRARI